MLMSLALILAGAAFGWTALFSFVVAPMAFRDLDAGRADRFVRNAIQSGHVAPAALALAAAVSAWAGGAPGAGALLAVTGLLFFAARFSVTPGARRRKATRMIASGLTAMLLPVTALGAGLAAMGV